MESEPLGLKLNLRSTMYKHSQNLCFLALKMEVVIPHRALLLMNSRRMNFKCIVKSRCLINVKSKVSLNSKIK